MLYALCAALSLALLGLDQWVKHYRSAERRVGKECSSRGSPAR